MIGIPTPGKIETEEQKRIAEEENEHYKPLKEKKFVKDIIARLDRMHSTGDSYPCLSKGETLKLLRMMGILIVLLMFSQCITPAASFLGPTLSYPSDAGTP